MALPTGASVVSSTLAHYPARAPEYYIVTVNLTDDRIQDVRNATLIAPARTAIITDIRDLSYAQAFTDNVLQVADINAARTVALQIWNTSPSAFIGRSIIIDRTQINVLTGVWDTREENIPV